MTRPERDVVETGSTPLHYNRNSIPYQTTVCSGGWTVVCWSPFSCPVHNGEYRRSRLNWEYSWVGSWPKKDSKFPTVPRPVGDVVGVKVFVFLLEHRDENGIQEYIDKCLDWNFKLMKKRMTFFVLFSQRPLYYTKWDNFPLSSYEKRGKYTNRVIGPYSRPRTETFRRSLWFCNNRLTIRASNFTGSLKFSNWILDKGNSTLQE